jgi:hypothetical protein
VMSHPPQLKEEDRYTVKQPNKKSPPNALSSAFRTLAKWAAHHRRTVPDQMIRGASYGLGSGAVSLLVVWFEARH